MKENLEQAAISANVPGIGPDRKVSPLREEILALKAARAVPKDEVPMKAENKFIEVKDIMAAAFLCSHGLICTVSKKGSQISFAFPGIEETRLFLEAYKNNPSIKAADFAGWIRRLNAQVVAMRK